MAGITKRGATWHIRMRVPRRYRTVHNGHEIHRSLRTDSRRRAQELMPAVEAKIREALEAKLAVKEGRDASEAFRAAQTLTSARGFEYRTISEVAAMPTEELVDRIEAAGSEAESSEVRKALLGGVEEPSLMVSELVEKIEAISAHENRYKSDNQMRLWRHPRQRAVRNLVAALGRDIEVQAIGSAEALKHKNWWLQRMAADGVKADTAVKDFAYMAGMLRRYNEHNNVPDAPRPYSRISIADRHKKKSRKFEIPVDWIKEKWFAKGALAGLNDEARDILLISIETGCRQSEIYDLPSDAIVPDAPIPFIRIDNTDGEYRREVKNMPSCRHVPLVGVALAAARRHPDGFPRYRGKSKYSAAVNKYLRERGLMPSPKHTIGGTRHTWETRLKAAKIDSDDRGEMMGHDVAHLRDREWYGDEMPLPMKLELAEKVVLPVPPHLA